MFRRFLLPAILLLTAQLASAMTLEEAIDLGKRRSLRMEDPRIERVRVEGRIHEAWSNALPQIQGIAAYQRYWKPAKVFVNGQPIQFQQDNNALGQATLTQPIYTFGRVAAGLRAAYAGEKSNTLIASNTSRSVELDVIRRYGAVLLMRDVVEARRQSLAVSDSNLTRVQRMRDVGLRSDYDVLRSQVQASNQIPEVQQAENDLHLAELSLFELLGVPLDTTVTIEGKLEDYAARVSVDTTAADYLKRDDLEALRQLTQLQKNVYILTRNADLPVLSGVVDYTWQWTANEWELRPDNNVSSVYGGLSLSIPIWTSGKNIGRGQQAKADWRRSELDLQQAERGAKLQLESAVRTYETAQASETSARLTVQQAEEARSIAQTKLAQGQITQVEMDAAQLEELVARVALAQATFNRLVAAAETRMALGLSPFNP